MAMERHDGTTRNPQLYRNGMRSPSRKEGTCVLPTVTLVARRTVRIQDFRHAAFPLTQRTR